MWVQITFRFSIIPPQSVTAFKLSRHVAKDCRHSDSFSFPPLQRGSCLGSQGMGSHGGP